MASPRAVLLLVTAVALSDTAPNDSEYSVAGTNPSFPDSQRESPMQRTGAAQLPSLSAAPRPPHRRAARPPGWSPECFVFPLFIFVRFCAVRKDLCGHNVGAIRVGDH